MARKRKSDQGSGSLHRTLTPPGLFLARMVIFLTLVGFLITILHRPLIDAVGNNPALNGLIIAVLCFGILYSFNQVLRLYPEIRWVNAFRIADPGLTIAHKPRLLAPMATLLRDRTGAISLSTASMTSIMDSLSSRLDEARDTGRYLVGLLVFLGLLGTFWGLLETIKAVGSVIGSIDTNASDTVQLFGDLKAGLSAPMQGMGTAFSSSLLGLAGSLILGFLELQASHAHNRFYNELEDWLSGITELTPGTSIEDASTDEINRQLYGALFEVQRSLTEIADRLDKSGDSSEIADGIGQLVTQMRREQEIIRQWADEQSSQHGELLSSIRASLENRRPPRRN